MLISCLSGSRKSRTSGGGRRQRPSAQPQPEALEDRALPSGGLPFATTTPLPLVFRVTNTLDNGPGSLRQAILDSNNHPGTNVIDFRILSGMRTITPLSALPTITVPVVIDGTTQPGFAGSPIIELSGANLGPGDDGLQISAGHSTVRGLVINRFGLDGIELDTNGGDVIQGNFLGTDVSGTVGLGNSSDDVFINGVSNNLIGGTTFRARNIIAAATSGIMIAGSGATGNLVEGNYIGTDVTGRRALGNNSEGVAVRAPHNTIGGTTAAARNVISGNGAGVDLGDFTPAMTGNRVEGNYIGTDPSGTTAVGNGLGVTVESSGNTIGGMAAGAGNLISGNGTAVDINGSDATRNLVQGNDIGTDKSGKRALGNSGDGVAILFAGADNNTIGGTAPAARNLISDSGRYGIEINGVSGAGATGNLVQGNQIGADGSANRALGNTLDGVFIDAPASRNTIGGTAARAENLIAANHGAGVDITGAGATGNALLANAIFANGGPGIDLGDDGITPNDSLGHAGPNNYQNFPILTSARISGGLITIQGTISSTANTTFRLEFFASALGDLSGFGQGQTFLGFARVTTDGSGHSRFTVTFAARAAEAVITATATDPAGNTSEFSQAVLATALRSTVSGSPAIESPVSRRVGG
jgi:hypothetical protein